MAEGVVPPPPWEQEKAPPPPWEESFPKPKSVKERAASNLESMQSGPAALQYAKAQASADRDIAVKGGKGAEFAGMAAGTAVGALSLNPWLAGLAQGAVREGTKKLIGIGQTDNTKLAMSLGVDTLTYGLGAKALDKIGGALLPKMMERSAASTQAGQKMLSDAYVAVRERMLSAVEKAGFPTAEVRPVWEHIEKGLSRLAPARGGGTATELTSLSEKAAKYLGLAQKDLKATPFGYGSDLELHHIIESAGNLQQAAWSEVKPLEKKVLQEGADKLSKIARQELYALDKDLVPVYDRAKELGRVQFSKEQGIDNVMQYLSTTKRKILSAGGELVGLPEISTFALQWISKHPQGAEMMSRAAAALGTGAKSAFASIMKRAFDVSGAGYLVDSIAKQKKAAEDSMRMSQPQQ